MTQTKNSPKNPGWFTQEGETEEDFNPILGHGNKFGFSEPGYYRLTVDSSNLDAVYFSVKYIGDTSSVNIHYLPFEKADNVWGVSFDAESVFAYGTDEYITEIVFDESVADEAGYTVDVDAKYDGLNLGITVDNLENDSSIRYTILPVAQPEIWLREGYANVYSELPAEENQSCL